jgi:hypothetical protein
LEQAGLVTGRKQQYYVVYQVQAALLDRTLRELVGAGADLRPIEERRQLAYHQKILATFFTGGRLRQLPAQRKKRLVVLAAFAADFELDRGYAEAEVNETVGRRYADYCTVRRELVDAQLMTRAGIPGQALSYRRTGAVECGPLPQPAPGKEDPVPATRDERKRLIELYKQTRKTAGVYGIRNTQTGRVLLGSSLNLHGPLQRHRVELSWGSHRCPALQADWDRLGADAFVFEVLDTVAPALEGLERDAELKRLEQKWLAAFQPFAERCYNAGEQIRTKPF